MVFPSRAAAGYLHVGEEALSVGACRGPGVKGGPSGVFVEAEL